MTVVSVVAFQSHPFHWFIILYSIDCFCQHPSPSSCSPDEDRWCKHCGAESALRWPIWKAKSSRKVQRVLSPAQSSVRVWYTEHWTLLHPLWWARQEGAAKTHHCLPSWYFDIKCSVEQGLCACLSHTYWIRLALGKLRCSLVVPVAWEPHLNWKVTHTGRLNWPLCTSVLCHAVLDKGPSLSNISSPFSHHRVVGSINSETYLMSLTVALRLSGHAADLSPNYSLSSS